MGCVVPAPHVKKAVDSQRNPARVLLEGWHRWQELCLLSSAMKVIAVLATAGQYHSYEGESSALSLQLSHALFAETLSCLFSGLTAVKIPA